MNYKNVRTVLHPQKSIKQTYRWLSGLEYQDRLLSWVECIEERADKKTRFVYITDLEANFENAIELAASGRLRFKIENEGFNTLNSPVARKAPLPALVLSSKLHEAIAS